MDEANIIFNQAQEKEMNEEYVDAIRLYEHILTISTKAPEKVYINLAFLYWQLASDYGFSSHYNIPSELSDKAGREYPKLINRALVHYPDSLELKFWSKYFPYRFYDDKFSCEECEQMIKEHNGQNSLVPYFYLYLFDNDRYKVEKDELLKQCETVLTAKQRYIKSIIS